MRHRGYGQHVVTEDKKPIDPEFQRKRAELMARLLGALGERPMVIDGIVIPRPALSAPNPGKKP